MISTPKVVMVNYLNSRPFEYGLRHTAETCHWDIIKATPSKCVQIYTDRQADIALLPAGALHDLQDYDIITDFCIGCHGEVRTVCIFSNEPLETCSVLHLDTHSRTSVLLSKLLTTEYMGLNLEYHPLSISDYMPVDGEAVLMIGDKVFDFEKDFKYKYDLGSIWMEWTGLPFVFAVWIQKKGIDPSVSQLMNEAFEFGIGHIPEVISQQNQKNIDLEYYYSHHIQYKLDEQKRNALHLFLEKSSKFQLQTL